MGAADALKVTHVEYEVAKKAKKAKKERKMQQAVPAKAETAAAPQRKWHDYKTEVNSWSAWKSNRCGPMIRVVPSEHTKNCLAKNSFIRSLIDDAIYKPKLNVVVKLMGPVVEAYNLLYQY